MASFPNNRQKLDTSLGYFYPSMKRFVSVVFAVEKTEYIVCFFINSHYLINKYSKDIKVGWLAN